MERVSSDEEAYDEEEDAVDVATDLCVCALKRVLEPRHRYSVYLLYWYKSTNTDAASLGRVLLLRTGTLMEATSRALEAT